MEEFYLSFCSIGLVMLVVFVVLAEIAAIFSSTLFLLRKTVAFYHFGKTVLPDSCLAVLCECLSCLLLARKESAFVD